MNVLRQASWAIAAALLGLFSLEAALGRVTTSKVLCDCISASDIARETQLLERMVAESLSIGKVIGIVITNVSSDPATPSARDELRKRSMALLSALRALGLENAQSSIEFVEASPSDYGCKGAALAVNVEFVYEHR